MSTSESTSTRPASSQREGWEASATISCVGRLTAFVGSLTFAAAGHAHPGHDWRELGAGHVLTSPYHLAVLAFAGAGLWLVARFLRADVHRRLARVVGIAAVLAAGLVWTLRP